MATKPRPDVIDLRIVDKHEADYAPTAAPEADSAVEKNQKRCRQVDGVLCARQFRF